MEGIEFYLYDNELCYRRDDGQCGFVTENDVELISLILNKVRESYPEAYSKLQEVYQRYSGNIMHYNFLMAKRFCKCNFCNLDTTSFDIERTGVFNFEKVKCPLRGECSCEGIICSPKFNTKLSSMEYRVMALIYDGMSKEQIATELCISPHTVKNHIKSAYCKLGVHERSEFIRYANNHNLFN